MIETHQPACDSKRSRTRKENVERQPAPERTRHSRVRALQLDIAARCLEELSAVHSSRARCLAGEAPEAVAHLVRKLRRHVEFAVGDGPHQGDPATGAVPFPLGRIVGRAGRQAHAAVHALLEDRIVERPDGVGHHFAGDQC